jgi:SAM-dependent methyltransferase
MKEDKVRKIVREGYAKIARSERTCCSDPACCTQSDSADMDEELSRKMGYSEVDMESVPEGANLGLGCGNPIALASLQKGETVLDLGSGGGFDCFLAANRVGNDGKVIGVDMTPEMIDKARRNARKGNYHNVEFRLGEIENLPVADSTVDVVISNCVINLSPNKKRVFEEAFRVLKPSGRLMVSDIVLLKELPEIIRKNAQALVGCISGAEIKDKYLGMIEKAGFDDIKVMEENHVPIEDIAHDSTARVLIKEAKLPAEKVNEIAKTILSVRVSATKPGS